ncbi:hypothetical protein LFM09_16575 [Lentzea alba]|uniref:hypothetical protein n=1 Tax=Lentzea alba TaxID=2714351 RepID=UPI0039BF3C1F
MQKKIGAVVLAAAALAVTFTGTAQAETNPSCSTGVSQIGATKYIKSGSRTIASVKQFVGCNKNWGYIYVWDSWRADHKRYSIFAGVQVRGAEFPSGYTRAENKQALWSEGTKTLDKCTKGYGSIQAENYGGGVETEERC